MMQYSLRLFSLGLIGALLVLPAWAATPVSNRDQVQIDRDDIRLGDVFTGLPASLDESIATAPTPGRSVTYNYTVLSKLAQRYGLVWQADSYEDQTVISRASNRISAAMVCEAVIAQLRAQGVQGEIDVAQVTPLVGSAMEKLRDGKLISAQEAKAHHLVEAHTAVGDVGKVAEAAGVKVLVLSHLAPVGGPDSRWQSASSGYSGRVVVAHDRQWISAEGAK